MNDPENSHTRPNNPQGTSTRDAWLTTTALAALAAGLLAYAAHQTTSNLLGIAALSSLATALTIAIHAHRRSRQTHINTTTKRPPSVAPTIALITILTAATALLALAAIVTHY